MLRISDARCVTQPSTATTWSRLCGDKSQKRMKALGMADADSFECNTPFSRFQFERCPFPVLSTQD